MARDLQKQRDLNKPLQDKKDAAAEREKELGAKVEIKVRESDTRSMGYIPVYFCDFQKAEGRKKGENVITFNKEFEKITDKVIASASA